MVYHSSVVFLNEWLPNPVGADAEGEFVELFNGGAADARLDGWRLETEGGKKFALDGRYVPARGYLILKKKRHETLATQHGRRARAL